MHKLTILAGTLALALAWSIAPASATDPAQRAADKAERAADKAERAADKAADQADRAADKAATKADGTKETLKDKAIEAKDTIKEKTVETKDKVKAKMENAKDKMRAKTERADDRMAMTNTRAAQEALRTQGFDPGPADGRMGPRTRAAITEYQRREKLPVTGTLDDATMAKLNVRSSRTTDVPAASPVTSPDPKKQNP